MGTDAKFATGIPAAITAPDEIETRLGTLRFVDGFPDDETTQKVFDNVDFQRGVQAMTVAMPGASLVAQRTALRRYGPDNQTVIVFETLMDSRSLFLTANGETVYAIAWLDLSEGPVVVESPPGVLGLVDDFWFHYVADIGLAGPDRGQGGRFLFVPPGYEGALPDEGYFVFRSQTYGNVLALRGFVVEGDPAPAVGAIKEHVRIYPLAQASDPPEVTFVNVSGESMNTIHAMDFSFFEEVNQLVQEEPNAAMDPETLGLLASIGIEHGRRFAPDERMKAILTDAAVVGSATVRANAYRCRLEEAYLFPDSAWCTPFVGGSHEFLRDGVRLLDARAFMFFYATGITPAMTIRMVGAGSAYAARLRRRGRPALRRRQDLSADPATRRPREDVLVSGALRHPDPVDAPDRPAVPQHRQSERRPGHQPGRLHRPLLRTRATPGPRVELGADLARQGLDRHPAPLRPRAAVVRPDLATRRDRAPRLSPRSSGVLEANFCRLRAVVRAS